MISFQEAKARLEELKTAFYTLNLEPQELAAGKALEIQLRQFMALMQLYDIERDNHIETNKCGRPNKKIKV